MNTMRRRVTWKTKLGQLAATVVLLGLAIFALASPRDLLGPGDTIRVTVFQNPDLTTEARLSSRGTIAFPLIGEVAIGERTPIQAGATIAGRLKKGGFVRDPQVHVTLVEVRSRRVSVLGHVSRPGQYPLDGSGLTLTDLIAQAGGITGDGDHTVVVITRREGAVRRLEIDVPGMYRSGDLSRDIELHSGDTVFVPGAPVFYVYGAVQRAGAYRLGPDTSVLSALSLGGGLTPRGSERGIRIHRRSADGQVEELAAKLTDAVRENDVIRVPESFF